MYLVSGGVFVWAFFPYLLSVIRKESKPRTATWLIWFIGDVIVLTGMLAQGTYNGVIIVGTIGALLTFILSFVNGEKGWNRRDKICVALSLAAIGLWIWFGDSSLGIAFSLLSLWIAAWPTYVSAWKDPANEDKKGWILFNLSSFLALFAIPQKTFADIAPPVVFVIIDGPLFVILVIIPWAKSLLARYAKAC